MKIVVKSDGKIVKEKTLRNELHFEVQKNTRANVIESKKTYRRSRQKHLDRKSLDY